MKRVLWAVLALFIISPLVYAQEPGLLNKVSSRVRSIGEADGAAEPYHRLCASRRPQIRSPSRSNTSRFDPFHYVRFEHQRLRQVLPGSCILAIPPETTGRLPHLYTHLKPGWDAGFPRL